MGREMGGVVDYRWDPGIESEFSRPALPAAARALPGPVRVYELLVL